MSSPEEYASDSDSDVSDNGSNVLDNDPEKDEAAGSYNIEDELEEENQVMQALDTVREKTHDTKSDRMLKKIESVTDSILNPVFYDITNMFSNGAIFFVDGDSLLLNIVGDTNYDPHNGGQLLHFIYICERHLQLFTRMNGVFKVVFLNIWDKILADKPALLLARSVLKAHLKFNMSCEVYEFDVMWDDDFRKLIESCKCSFLLTDLKLLDVCGQVFPDDNQILQTLFHVTIGYCLMGLSLPLVDMNSVELKVSTLNAFYCSPGPKVGHERLKKMWNAVIDAIQKKFGSCTLERTKVLLPAKYIEGEIHVRRAITIAAAAHLHCHAPESYKDWIRVFLLYSAVLEVLPLKFRGCVPVHGKATEDYKQFLFSLQQCMNSALQEVVSNTRSDSFKTLPDLWHGNFFVTVVDFISKQENANEIRIGIHTQSVYESLVQEVVNLSGKPLAKYPITVNKLKCSTEKTPKTKVIAKISLSLKNVKLLVPMNCLLTNEFCKSVLPEMNFPVEDEFIQSIITRNSTFEEKKHWHTKRLLTDHCDRIRNTIRKAADKYEARRINRERNNYAYFMSLYGSSIEGRSLDSKTIVCENSSNKKRVKQKKVGKKAQSIIEQNIKDKEKKKEVSDRLQFSDINKRCNELIRKGEYEKALEIVKIAEEHMKTENIFQKLLMCKVKILWYLWETECRNVTNVRERNLQYAKQIFQAIRKILKDFGTNTLSKDEAEKLGQYLQQMGLQSIAERWKLPQSSKSTTESYTSIGMSSVDFQLLHLGEDLDRDFGGEPDNRVEGFIPDKWQRKLFDSIDKRQSVLVVAPTSSGKTYASYYCMEKVLREGNDGVVVYVAPTKALVNQVAATIYARFKNKEMPDGKSVYGVFTRDYRTNALNSQILVTVPECLELLLLSPRRHDWVQRLQYVIFDEIHCLAGQAGGFSWECGLLLIRCPFLALSATIDEPETLHAWLQSMQTFKQKQDEMNGSTKSHNCYKVNLVVYSDRHADLKKQVYCEDGRFIDIHPYAYVDQALIIERQCIPSSISLSPDEVHELYSAMKMAKPQNHQIAELDPQTFFSTCEKGFISRNLVRSYEKELRELLASWALNNDSAFHNVIQELKPAQTANENVSEMRFISENFIQFICRLKEENMLPAIAFSYSRNLVGFFFEEATEFYANAMEEYDGNNETASGKDPDDSKRTKNAAAKGENDFRLSRGYRDRNKFTRSLNLLHSEGTKPTALKNVGLADPKVVEYIEKRLIGIGYKDSDSFPSGLRCGIGMHYGGMNAKERSAVEMLFRMKMLNLVFATGTLALGIHMPCKTVAIVGDSPYLNPLEFQQMSGRAGRRGFDTSGNVVFMGLNERKMCTLLTGKLPKMIGNFPLNVTMVLRTLLMVTDITSEGTHKDEATRQAISRALTMLNCCLVYQTFPELKTQMKHYFSFSTQLLMLQGLLDDEGKPQFMTGIVTHLNYHEPGNLAFVYLWKSGVLRKICKKEDDGRISKETQMTLIVVLSYLFAIHPLHSKMETAKFENSKVVLPPLPPEVREVLEMYNNEVNYIFDNYFRNVTMQIEKEMGPDTSLPLSRVKFEPQETFCPATEGPMDLEKYIMDTCNQNTICSSFAALSGHSDDGLYSSSDTITNIRHQVFTDVKVVPLVEMDTTYNGYAWDFYNHGNQKAMRNDNKLRQGDDFSLLLDFLLVLKVIKTTLEEFQPIDEGDAVFKTFSIIEEEFRSKFEKAYYNIRGLHN
ncbi:probable ATP-dependent RNA helicase DDX60 [Periplaneta americana]|uniref:probable ATP-dependent RNA helicase DDX60 n=1 Tax=Periplaneta americana TaxID=6978 RepID=UPI0037E8F936